MRGTELGQTRGKTSRTAARAPRLAVLVVSDILPADTSGGHLVLHRHLQDYKVLTPPWLWNTLHPADVSRRLGGLLQRFGFTTAAAEILYLNKARWIDRRAKQLADQCDVILTVAQGDAFEAAVRIAARYRKPLVTIFHDWWPDMAPSSLADRIDKRIRRLYATSDLALCVSPGMIDELGPHPNARLLWPIPSVRSQPAAAADERARDARPFRVHYMGNLAEYGDMLRLASAALPSGGRVRLEIRGRTPDWPQVEIAQLRAAGCLHEFAKGDELTAWLESADAYLIAMSFEPTMRRRMETSFPSKLCEFVQYGKPLVIWGPDYCSAVRWAKERGKALCVLSDDAGDFARKVIALADEQSTLVQLEEAAKNCARKEFNPITIQQDFDASLLGVVSGTS